METAVLKKKIITYFQEHNKEITESILKLLAEMVKERTVNVITEKLSEHPYLHMRGEEYRVAEIVKREFTKWGIPFEVFERQKGRTNVVGRVGSGKNPLKLFMACHMDVVPAGDGWDTDPFTMTIKDGKVFGRGVLDNKGPLVASMLAGYIMKNAIGDAAINGELQISALADEEATDPDGIDYGIGYLLEDNLISPTYAIIPDIGENMKKIDISEKGRLVVKITARGKQAHGSTPERGINAINRMARFLALLEQHTLAFEPNPVLDHPTLNVGEIKGGAAPNIVPAECTVALDIRILPGQTSESVIAELKSISDTVSPEFTFELQSGSKPHYIDPNNELVKSIQENTHSYLGVMPEPFGLGGGTFAKTLNLRGIKAVGFGPGDDTAFYVFYEFVEIKQLVDFTCLICLVALDLLQ